LRRSNQVVVVLALGLMSLAGCNFNTDRNGTAGSGGGTGSGTSAAGPNVATLHWEMPTETTNGTPLGDLQGYTIVYGSSPETMNQWVQISDIGTTSYVVSGLESGTWYFAILSYTASGVNSALSNVVSKTIS
jgi:hypothetical protein